MVGSTRQSFVPKKEEVRGHWLSLEVAQELQMYFEEEVFERTFQVGLDWDLGSEVSLRRLEWEECYQFLSNLLDDDEKVLKRILQKEKDSQSLFVQKQLKSGTKWIKRDMPPFSKRDTQGDVVDKRKKKKKKKKKTESTAKTRL